MDRHKWPLLARKYLEQHAYEVDIERLIVEYSNKVQEFHKWFRESIMATFGGKISEYRSYERILNGEGWRNHWRQVLNYCIEHQLDPYQYLKRFLSPTEVEKVNQLPPSKEQVDLMIKLADDFDICDDEIRSLVYKLFGIERVLCR